MAKQYLANEEAVILVGLMKLEGCSLKGGDSCRDPADSLQSAQVTLSQPLGSYRRLTHCMQSVTASSWQQGLMLREVRVSPALPRFCATHID